MLGFSLQQGEFVVIGDAIIRLVEVRRGGARAAFAVQVDDHVPITRLDSYGNSLNNQRRIVERCIPSVDPSVAAGYVRLVLSCHHQVTVSADIDATSIECPHCRHRAEEIKARVQKNFDLLGPALTHLRGSKSCTPPPRT